MITLKQYGLAIGTLFFGFALAIYCYGYVAMEHPAYTWDWGTHFRIYQDFGFLRTNAIETWTQKLILSVRSEDYNASSVALLFPFYDAFGPSRIGYIFAIVACYLLPVALISSSLSINAARVSGSARSDVAAMAVLVLTILFPPFWQATLRGMPDIVGLIPLGTATWLILKSDFLSRKTVSNAILIGVMIWLAFVFRRWYAYACVALLACTFVVMVVRVAYEKKTRVARILQVAASFPVIGLVTLVLLLFFQFGLFLRIINTSYADLYSAYQQPLTDQILSLYQSVGPLYLVAFFIGLVAAVVKKSAPILFMASVGLVTFFLFSGTQAPGVQHKLPIFFFVLPAAMFGVHWLVTVLPSVPRLIVASALVLLSPAILLTATLPGPNAALPVISALGPTQTYFPLHVDNYSEYQRLIAELKVLAVAGERITIFASSELLSDSLLNSLDRSLERSLAYASQVDERDGFRLTALSSRYAVVADPVPLHLPNSQRVISVPAEHILNGTGIGSAYRRLSGPFDIAGGHKAFIYERIAPLDEKQVLELQDELAAFHPGWKWDGISTIYLPPKP